MERHFNIALWMPVGLSATIPASLKEFGSLFMYLSFSDPFRLQPFDIEIISKLHKISSYKLFFSMALQPNFGPWPPP
jgi:hypothetical protein